MSEKTVKVKITKENNFGHKVGDVLELHPSTAAAIAAHGHTDYKVPAKEKGETK